MRTDRLPDEMRLAIIETEVLRNSPASVFIRMGETFVLCAAKLERGVPPFLEDTGSGWLTCEYAMLPASTVGRKKRDILKKDGRSVEIQRMIGRSLRSVCDFEGMGEYTIHIDCDVLNADGGTRTASVNGAFTALSLCADQAVREGTLLRFPVNQYLGAISAGIVGNTPMLDLCYEEDHDAQADMNMIAAENGEIAELQISGEKRPVTKQEFDSLFRMCQKGIAELIAMQRELLGKEGIAL